MRLAVLITYHNEAGLLRECLESVRAQTAPVDEIVVYDDASRLPAGDYVPAGMEVRVIRGASNVGPSVGRNRLLAATGCDWVHFHDSDDLFQPDWCRRIREEAAAGADAVFTEASFFSAAPAAVRPCVVGLDHLSGTRDLTRFCIHHVMLTPCGAYRRTVVENVGGYREDLWQSEDYDFHIRLAASGIRYGILPEPLVLCRSRIDSRSRNEVEVQRSLVQAMERLSGELDPGYQVDLAETAARAGSRLFFLGDLNGARSAFCLARRLGPPQLLSFSPRYRTVGRILGLEAAEWMGWCYRRALPERLRRRFS
jgi:glycosyltransferase involved in cell wall biosynthesis